MIDVRYGKAVLICDICEEETECESFNDAVATKVREGWKSTKDNNTWIDVCPDCQEEKRR